MDDEEIRVCLGRQLRKYRKQNLLTLEEAAEKVGMDDKHLGKIERGVKDTTFTTLFKLMKALNIPSEFIDDIKNDNT